MITIIAASGYGKRMLPYTKYIPKAMLPINGKFALSYTIDEAMDVSEKILITVNHLKNTIIRYCKDLSASSSTDIQYVYQQSCDGTASAVLACASIVFYTKNVSCFSVIFPDMIIDHKDEVPSKHMANMKKICLDTGMNVVAMKEVPLQDISLYGIACIKDEKMSHDDKDYDVVDYIKEKPTELTDNLSRLAVIGRVVFNKDVMVDIQTKSHSHALDGGEYGLTQFYNGAIIYRIDDDLYDIGSHKGYKNAWTAL